MLLGEVHTGEKQQHWPLFKEGFTLSHQSIQSMTDGFKLNSKLSAPPPGGIADNPSDPPPLPRHPLYWPWHQWQPIDLWFNPSLPIDSPTVLAHCLPWGATRMHTQLCEQFSCFFWELVHVSAGWKLRLVKCDYWCAQSLGYCCRWAWCRVCSDLLPPDFTAFPPLLQHISVINCQPALETPYVLVFFFFFFPRDLSLPVPLSAFQESSRWSKSRMEDLTGLFCSHGTHQSSRLQLGMLRFAENNRVFFSPCHFLFDANMLFLCSCVHKTHVFFHHMLWH